MFETTSTESRNPNRPPPGSTIKVDPIRSITAINEIKANLSANRRNYCLFVLGINTGFRASELLSIRLGQVRYLAAGDRLVSIDSRSVKDLGIKTVVKMLSDAPGTRVKLEIRQAESLKDVELELARIL